MTQTTALHHRHAEAGARLVDFAGWDMPLHYGSQLDEHHAVRQSAGVFDVSHMCAIDIEGSGACASLRFLLANDVDRVPAGKALYSCMLNHEGGVVDDLIVYRLGRDRFRVVVNAGTADKDLAWIQQVLAGHDTCIRVRRDLGILAVQGPRARELAAPLLPAGLRDIAAALPPFGCAAEGDRLVGRTGYTGEDGYELIVPSADLLPLWDGLLAAGVRPAGLGARDTLRLEAGMNLYGQDMDEQTSPLAAGLGWTVAWEPADRDFIGRAALQAQRAAGAGERFVGLLLVGRGVMRHGQTVRGEAGAGVITSGGFGPTVGASIALARVPAATGDTVEVDIRGKGVPARVVKAPFVRNGKVLVDTGA